MPQATGPKDAATQSFYYYGFGAGEYGAQAGHLVGYRLQRQTLYYAGAFTGRNVLRYIDGSVGPRLEAVDITPSGLPPLRCFGLGMGTAPGTVTPSQESTQYLWALYTDAAPGQVSANPSSGTFRIPLQAGGTAVAFQGPSIPVPQSGAGTTTMRLAQFGSDLNQVARQTTAVPDYGGMIQSVAIGNTVYLTSQGNGFYVLLFDPQFTGQAGVVGFVGNAQSSGQLFPDGYPLCLYGTFMVGTSFAQPNQLRFSADSNYLDWSVTPGHGAFLFVGDETPIVGLFPTRHGLYIAKSTSWPMLAGDQSPTFSVDQWWLMTGTPGTGAIVRKVLDGPVATNDSGVVLGDGTIGYLSPGASKGSAPLQMTPSVFTGAAIQSYRYLTGAGQFTLDNFAGVDAWMPTAVRLHQPHDWLVVPQSQTFDGAPSGYVRRDGIWTALNLGTVTSGGFNGTNVTAVSDPQNDRVFTATTVDHSTTTSQQLGGGNTRLFITKPAEQHILMWSAYAEQPSTAAFPQADPSQCQFSLPEWTSRGGGEVMVESVWVDFEVWATTGTPSLTMTVQVLRKHEGGDATPIVMVCPGLTASSAPPTRHRHVFKPGPWEFGNAFQLTFSNLSGVSVEKVEVLMATRPSQG